MVKLTEKQKAFCREYVRNGGNGTEAYLATYDSQSRVVASNESSKLLRRDDITEYIATVNGPLENRITNEREKKRRILWDGIEECKRNGDHTGVARYMDILNKMDQEYINITRDVTDKNSEIVQLDSDTLRRIAGTA